MGGWAVQGGNALKPWGMPHGQMTDRRARQQYARTEGVKTSPGSGHNSAHAETCQEISRGTRRPESGLERKPAMGGGKRQLAALGNASKHTLDSPGREAAGRQGHRVRERRYWETSVWRCTHATLHIVRHSAHGEQCDAQGPKTLRPLHTAVTHNHPRLENVAVVTQTASPGARRRSQYPLPSDQPGPPPSAAVVGAWEERCELGSRRNTQRRRAHGTWGPDENGG